MIKFFTFSISIILGIFIVPSILQAEELSVTHTVYLEKGNVVDPTYITRTNDNGFVITGSLNDRGWATRTDSEGNVKWRYLPELRDDLPLPRRRFNYSSAAVMPDDSVFLCGTMPGSNYKDSGLLTHIDKNGRVLSEQLLKPEGFDGGGFGPCMAWNGGLAVVGGTVRTTHIQPTEKHPLPFDSQGFYWIADFDAAGKMQWGKIVPLSDKLSSTDSKSQLQSTVDGGFAFVGTRNPSGTELVHVKPDGDIEKKFLSGIYTIVLSPHSASNLEFVSISTKSLELLKLDNNLEKTIHLKKEQESGEVKMAYRLSDESLLLFGSKLFKNTFFARILKVDSNLNKQQNLDVSQDGASYWVAAAVPLDNPGEFASVRRALIQSNTPIMIESGRVLSEEERLKRIRLGVALDFIKIKQ